MKKTVMLKEIHQQPAVVEKLLLREMKNIGRIGKAIRDGRDRFIALAARGSSDNAAVYAKYLIEYRNAIPCALAAPSIFTVYDRSVACKGGTFIGISQSGAGQDIVETLKRARRGGAFTVAITNTAGSPITKAADEVILLHAGEERALAATKTYTAELMAVMMLSAALGPEKKFSDMLAEAPAQIEKTLEVEPAVAALAERCRFMEHCAIIGRGFNYATVKEAALKMMETCYLVAESFSTADFLHGPIAMTGQGFPVFIAAADGKMAPAIPEMIGRLNERGAETIAFSARRDILSAASISVQMPVSPAEIVCPLFYIIPFQLFSNYCSLTRGINPDSPRYLKKVTRTF